MKWALIIMTALCALGWGLWWKSLRSSSDSQHRELFTEQVEGRQDAKLPLILSGNFHSPHLSTADLLTDNFLDSLIRGEKTRQSIDRMYGTPISVTKLDDLIVVNYNLAVYDPKLREAGGRVGFVGTFKDNIIESWSPITQH